MSIEPALTAEEWTVALAEMARVPHPEAIDADLAPAERAFHRLPPRRTRDWTHARMAVENVALPDDHPGKITREDVTLLLDEAIGIEGDTSTPGWPYRSPIRDVAAKLAALLPPDEEPAR